jgi:hypothetical protein
MRVILDFVSTVFALNLGQVRSRTMKMSKIVFLIRTELVRWSDYLTPANSLSAV